MPYIYYLEKSLLYHSNLTQLLMLIMIFYRNLQVQQVIYFLFMYLVLVIFWLSVQVHLWTKLSSNEDTLLTYIHQLLSITYFNRVLIHTFYPQAQLLSSWNYSKIWAYLQKDPFPPIIYVITFTKSHTLSHKTMICLHH